MLVGRRSVEVGVVSVFCLGSRPPPPSKMGSFSGPECPWGMLKPWRRGHC